MTTTPLTLHPPLHISARLMAAVHVGKAGAALHIAPLRRDSDGRVVWHYVIEDNDHQILDEATDLRSGTDDPLDARKTMATLVGYLEAAADAYRYTITGGHSDNADLFPPQVMEWAYEHDDELAALALDLEHHRPARRLRIIRRFTPDDITNGDINYRDHDTETIDCEPHDDEDTAITNAADALREAGCTQPSTTPGPMRLGDVWTDPDGSHIVNHHTALRCTTTAIPQGFTTDEINAINQQL